MLWFLLSMPQIYSSENCLPVLNKINSPNVINLVIIQYCISPIGNKPREVGTRTEGSRKSGWASDVDRIPGLEAVEMQTQAEALRWHLSSWEPQVNSLCGRIIQPRDAKRLKPSCNWEYVVSKYTYLWLAMWWHMYKKYKCILFFLFFRYWWRMAENTVYAQRDVCRSG